MTKKKSAKRAFISSVMSVILCFTMLVGTTFAWYTDSVTSGRNTIVAGSLDILLEKYVGTNGDFSAVTNWVTVDDQTKIFNEVDDKLTFEPGAVQVAYVRVSNNGDLAFKYSLAAKVFSETKGTNQAGVQYKLSDYLKFGTVALDGTSPAPFANREAAIAAVPNATKLQDATLSANGAYLAKGAAPVIVALVVYMPSDVGNVANPKPDKKPEISFGLNALATQYTIESDSFSNTYDEDSVYEAAVANTDAFFTAINDARISRVILSSDIEVTKRFPIGSATGDKEIDLNGHKLSIRWGTDACTVSGGKSLVLKDSVGTGSIEMQDTAPNLAIAFKVSGAGSTITADNINIKMTMREGAAPSASSPAAVALYAGDNGTLIINGGSITSNDAAIRVKGRSGQPAHAIINNATVNGNYSAILAGDNANVTINGGTYTGTSDAIRYGGANTEVTITDGTFTGTNGYAVNFTTTGSSNKVLNISGGTLNGGTGDINETTGSTVNDTRN